MLRNLCNVLKSIPTMANLPPRKISTSNKASKLDASPLQILLQMGFPKHRALKALAATGNRSVQLASDWLLTHVNDEHIDADEPREYIFYASPTGPLLAQLLEFWEKSKDVSGWNGAHNFPPHITLVPFFKAPDDTSLQLAKAMKHVVEYVGEAPTTSLKLEPYISHNFMGLFISEEHGSYLKRIALEFVKQVSSLSCVELEAQVKSLHLTLAYHFEVEAFDTLKSLVDGLSPAVSPAWELRLYSRDPRFANHQVHKVTQGYTPKASDELELLMGDYVYIEDSQFKDSQDGWVYGTSWLTGVSGYLPAVYSRRTAGSDAWTLHRAVSLAPSNSGECKSESDSNTDGEMAYPYEDALDLGLEKSEESYKEWDQYWNKVMEKKNNKSGLIDITQGHSSDWRTERNGTEEPAVEDDITTPTSESCAAGERWAFAMRHGERVDLTYGQWVPYCVNDAGEYVRKDLNMPLTLPERAGGIASFAKDSPLTRVGQLQARLVGEGLRLAGVGARHVYASAALRCVQTAHEMLLGMQAGPSVKIRVEPGLFEYKVWHPAMSPFMTPLELHEAGFNVDLNYKPYVDLDITTTESLDELYERNRLVIESAVNDTESEGGNIMFVGHAATLDMLTLALQRSSSPPANPEPYTVSKHLNRVPYCALAALRSRPWRLVPPPCPPSINTSSGRFDWRLLLDL